MSDIFSDFEASYAAEGDREMTLREYLELCRDDPSAYANAAERMIAAIGEPTLVDTSKNERFGRIFSNRTLKVYPTIEGFFGMEDAIQRVVSYFYHAAQGLEERKQILYLLGPVGGGKSSLAERLKALMEMRPIYVLKAGDEVSPIFESPLGIFNPATHGGRLEKEYGIPRKRLTGIMSPWAVKRLSSFKGDISNISWRTVVRFEHRQATQYGSGRMWLAGDAAHLTGPVGVLSMNLGLVEGYELAGIIADGGKEPELQAFNHRWSATWRQVHGMAKGLPFASDSDPWLASHIERILPCLPGWGRELAAIASNLAVTA